MGDRYGRDVLSADPHRPRRRRVAEVEAEPGLVVECAESGWCGAVVGTDKGADGWAVVLEDRRGARRPFAMRPAAFLLDGEVVTLVRPAAVAPTGPERTASGSIAVPQHRAVVARGSRIWVEGLHDAELVEKVWGHDLRVEGVVVEPLHGADDLLALVRDFAPGPGRRVGVLLDHLVPGSKETRIADEVRRAYGAHVVVLGHPYVDVWQAIRPQVVGIDAWPVVPRDRPWKEGVLAALGRPASTPADVAAGWRWLLGHVRTYADLEPSLLARVEELIDVVTAAD
ncbi:MAG TPA: DUF3097 domain-containing protein [Candidatus Angelobacter sp.]|nr:DUF3097 domain-containing protein [Candidatus Angelobacter sp.]